ncbi:MAG: transketolase [Flavobacteriaceae bacterium TMED68]|nr:MAG: transketolase [Flavobacteriaceae bacterium TMED68]
MSSIDNLQKLTLQVRRDILRMVHSVNSGHPGGSLGCTELFVALYNEILNLNEEFDMDGKNEDLFFLSNGHISPVFYSVLARKGFFPVSELATFRKLNSRLQGHPTTHEKLPGIRIASGSLGQGISVAIGSALCKKLNNDEKLVYVLVGDGELQEGQNWEAIMFSSAKNIDNLILCVDMNGKQIDGSTNEVLPMGNLKIKFEAFGWKVIEIENGNNIESIIKKLNFAKKETKKKLPICILIKTEMGHGVDFMMNTHEWHGVAPNDEQLEIALSQNPETIGDY